jgi:hypothetical protein
MNELTDNEKTVLTRMISEKGLLWTSLTKFFAWRAQRQESMCSSLMRNVPRDHERASDYAARAEENLLTMAQLEEFARDL